MRPTRFEIINELRSILGHTEETEILIDWLQDAWQTYDMLTNFVGKERAYYIINAVDTLPETVLSRGLTSYNHINEYVNRCLLN